MELESKSDNIRNERDARLVKTSERKKQLLSFVAWNVAGFPSGVSNLSVSCWDWMLLHLRSTLPNVVFLSETKLPADKLEAKFAGERWLSSNYEWLINSHAKPSSIHGVAMLLRRERFSYTRIPITMKGCLPRDSALKDASVDATLGRVLAVCIDGRLNLVGSYCPNSGVSYGNDAKFTAKVKYRVGGWDPVLHAALDSLAAELPTIWVGDLNVAPTELDVSDPEHSAGKAGTVGDRDSHNAFCSKSGWVDVWRASHPNERSMTRLGGCSGKRLDHVIVHSTALPNCRQSWIAHRTPTCLGHSSDHVHVGVTYELPASD